MPVCTQCHIEKNQEEFFWEKRRQSYTAACKACRNALSMAWAKNNRARANETAHRSYAKKVGKGLEECRAKRYTPEEWKIKERVRARAKYKANEEYYRAFHKKRYQENKERINAMNRAWAAKNGERLRAWSRRKYREDPVKAVARLAQRKAPKLQAQPLWLSAIHKAQILEMFDVAKAKSMQTGIKYNVDHMFPLINEKFCGLHVPWNLQVITEEQNKRKSTFFPAQFAHMACEGTPTR